MSGVATDKKKILVVDDEPEVVQLVGRRLQREGYAVITAVSGRDGFAKARTEIPHLILLDVIMPDGDGFSILKELKTDETTREIPVIMVTARSETDALLEGQRYGASDYFIKPVDWRQLLHYIKRYLVFRQQVP